MSRVREKKIKRLKKAHIWPAFVFFIISILLTALACAFFVSAILSYFATDRIESSFDNVRKISTMFSESMENGTEEMILRYLERNTDYSDAIYVLNADNEVIAGFGGETFDLNKTGEVTLFSGDRKFYSDETTFDNLINEEGDLDLRVIAAYAVGSNEDLISREQWRQKRVILTDRFWIGTRLANDDMLLVKCKIEFYNWDVALVGIFAIASLIVTLLPLSFLFINVLIGVSNQRRITRVLYTDPVTYGDNWMYFETNAEKILCSKKNADKLYAMVDIVIMKYRNFCTYHGVDAGEDLLEGMDKFLSQRITKKKELCAHNGRASFALLLRCTGPDDCRRRVDDMLTGLTNNLGHVGTAYHAGIYFIEPEKSENGKKCVKRKIIDIDECYNNASAARETIPEDDPKDLAVFDQKMLDEKIWEHKVETKMQKALDNEEFVVYIQPKYNPVTEKLAGAEALVRWINEEDGFIPPGRFIPIFEKNGFITKLDDYMISHVAKLQSAWIREGKSVVPISVNVSRAHFADSNLANHICELVDKYETPHKYIEIELTESAFFDNKAALLRTVRSLQEKGFEVSMDDFGAGYSSLNSLKDLPLDVLKLDADFFRGEDGQERGEIVVAQAIALAKKLNMRIVAEGIEKKEQVDFLVEQECDMIQGYYFAKPEPADEYAQRMQTGSEG